MAKLKTDLPVPDSMKLDIAGGGRVTIYAKHGSTDFKELARVRTELEKEHKNVIVSWVTEFPEGIGT